MTLFSTQSQNPIGLNRSQPECVYAYMRGGAGTKGQIVRFDLAASHAAVTASTNFGGPTNPTSNVLAATNTHNGFQTTTIYLYGILMEDIADNTLGRVCIRGVVQAIGGDTSGAGVGLAAGAGSRLVAVTDEVRCCAIALEPMANGALKWVLFDGINGFVVTGDVAP